MVEAHLKEKKEERRLLGKLIENKETRQMKTFASEKICPQVAVFYIKFLTTVSV